MILFTRLPLAALRACWLGEDAGETPRAFAMSRRRPRACPVDFGPGNANLLDVRDFPHGPNYRREASRFVTWIHERFRAGKLNTTARRIRTVKRRTRNSEGRFVMRVTVVAVPT